MMKQKSVFIFLCFLFFIIGVSKTNAQGYSDPTTWTISSSKNRVEVGDTIELCFYIEIKPVWYIYALEVDEVVINTALSINFRKHESFEIIGELLEVDARKAFDETWGGYFTYFYRKGRVKQKVKILKKEVDIVAEVEYQACTQEVCLPPVLSAVRFNMVKPK